MLELALEDEKRELEAMVERLARSPRLSKLLRYIGDRHLQGQDSLVREFDIATEVFGRTRNFDQSTDAIARVEIHRLRKKLTGYYQTEGRDNSIRISIPPGSYRLEFTRHLPDSPPLAEETKTAPQNHIEPPPDFVARPVKQRRWRVTAALCAVGLLLLVGFVLTLRNRPPSRAAQPVNRLQDSTSAALAGTSLPGSGADGKTIRILAGYQGQPHIDPSGNTWLADRFFERGGGWHGIQAFTARTNDEFLYRTYRNGEFVYALPLSPGVYELHLFFDETGYGPGLGGGESSRSFSIALNGQPLFPYFDIVSDAMGPNIADERIIRDVSPGPDGKLHLEFDGVSGKPLLSALEIVPGQLHRQLPVRLTAQPTPFLDRADNIWQPDNYFLGGQPSLQKPPVTGTDDPGLFAMERYGHFSYALPVDPRSNYSVTLYFAEFYFGPDQPGKGGVGSRVFNVLCNGTTLLRDFDIYREVGSLHALIKTFHHLKPSPQGKLNLTFEPSENYANISAIDVEDEGR